MTSKRIVITGGASNIGLAIARAFAAAGDRVFICDIDASALAKATADGSMGGALCDITDPAQVERFYVNAVAAMGGIDVLVNNTGVPGPTKPLEDIDLDEWDHVLNVNLTGAFLMCRAAIPHLKQSEAPSVIFMSSVSGRMGHPNRSPYATTKWGIIGLMKTLSRELGKYAIRCNAILPGAVDNERARKVILASLGREVDDVEAAVKEGLASRQSITQLVPMEAIASLAVYLASDASKLISGQAIPIDGDMRAG
jgi:NAD(P)-dependent dehydrogenase (short-subunit alcohol dehydrogenase family)